ncbi:hypothetical protein Pan44_13830 [Caulifigura coniformis]|uniref:Sialidase domain-containing protein n=1 Tax=Caulifigura coniformis TaxID=2527983 RepID=A0A517SBA9_9PLAN|nr:sialidase family protein [Caulifigura coniformis]QDT53366.1 hypothetical protein Pan44_13830 [Caulifigura coniformis]
MLSPVNRRHFLSFLAASAVVPCSSAFGSDAGLIRGITDTTLWNNLDGSGTTWFHPKVCMVPRPGKPPLALMNLQFIAGSDYFGPVHWSASEDNGQTWSEPVLIPGFERRPVPGHEGLLAGVCDVVPEYHAKTNTVLAVGEIVFYRGERFAAKDQLRRYPVYCVRKSDGTWTDRKILEWDDPRAAFIYSNNCGQRVTLPDGDILIAMSIGAKSESRSAITARCSFDGDTFAIRDVGEEIKHAAGRGLLEPSLTSWNGLHYMTIRAEDDRGYVCTSTDGLRWTEKQPWLWDDGEPLAMSSTQQHWLTHSDGLFLVYTRKDASNLKLIRWRAPLFVAQVDPQTLRLRRDTEQIVLPIRGDSLNDPNGTQQMGNFHIVNANADESWVTDGHWLPKKNARGELRMARIAWTKPNRLV